MIIAQIDTGKRAMRQRKDEPAAIGKLLPAIPGFAEEVLSALPFLPDENSKAVYRAKVLKLMEQFNDRGDKDAGRQRKRKILAILESFAIRPPVTIAVPPVIWKHLFAAASRIACRDEHWHSNCGPLIAASNAHLQRTLGWNAPRNNLRKLAEHGLAVPYCLAGNGKRYFDIGKKGAKPHASGWSLAPLLLLEDYLVALAEREARLAEHHLEIPRRITEATTTGFRLIRPFERDEIWARAARWKLEALSRAQRQYSRRRTSSDTITKLKRIAAAAESLLDRLIVRLSHAPSAALTAKNDTRVQHERHHLYSPESALNLVEGLAGRHTATTEADRMGEAGQRRCKGVQHAGDSEDPYGIKRSGFKWSEAPALFPFVDGLIELGHSPGIDALHSVARICQIAQPTAARASGEMGPEIALLCALITGDHLSKGQISKTPEAYMQALIRRARSGELNLGHTLFGRRQAIFGQKGQKASRHHGASHRVNGSECPILKVERP